MRTRIYPAADTAEAMNISEEMSKLRSDDDYEPVLPNFDTSEGNLEEGVSSTRAMRLRTQMHNNQW